METRYSENQKQTLKVQLIKRIGSEDKVEKKFTSFTPALYNYLDALENKYEVISFQIIENLARTNFNIKTTNNKNSRNQGECYMHPKMDNLDKCSFAVKLYPLVSMQTSISEPQLKDFIKLDPTVPQCDLLAPSNNDYGKQWLILKAFIHEMNHSICYTRLLLFKENGKIQKTGKITKQDLSNSTIYIEKGGLRIMKYEYDKNGRMYRASLQPVEHLLHEGITEYLAIRLLNDKVFCAQKIGNEIKIGSLIYDISYQPLYRMVAMNEMLNNHFLSNMYFSEDKNFENQRKLKIIVDEVSPIIKGIDFLTKKSKEELDIEEMDKIVYNLVNEITDYALTQKDKYEHLVSEKKQLNWKVKTFVNNYNRFLDVSTWSGFLAQQFEMINEDKKKIILKGFDKHLLNMIVEKNARNFNNSILNLYTNEKLK